MRATRRGGRAVLAARADDDGDGVSERRSVMEATRRRARTRHREGGSRDRIRGGSGGGLGILGIAQDMRGGTWGWGLERVRRVCVAERGTWRLWFAREETRESTRTADGRMRHVARALGVSW